MRGWQQARITNLEENGARLKRKSSSVFKSENDDEKHHQIVEALQNEEWKG